MKLLACVLVIALESLLVNGDSNSSCQPLNRALFNDCVEAGFNVSEVHAPSRSQNELFGLITNMKSKFKTCSSFSTLMTCSVHLPKCTTTTSMLPCKEVCKSFVADCQHSSGANEGLLALFRGVCEVLPGPSGKCLPKSGNFSGVHDSEEVKCRRLVIRQCQNAGYNFTSVSDEYQQMVNSSAIFQDSDVNSKLRKIICMEIAPPCDEKHNKTLLVPCRAMCNDAFNESSAKFLKVFNNTEYCSAFPENTTVNGSEYCSLQAWPSNGYWPSSLWTSLDTAEPTLAPTAIVTTPAVTAIVTKPAPTADAKTNATTPVTTPATTANATTPAPTTKVTRPATTANATRPATTANATRPAPTTKVTTPATTANATTPATTATATRPATMANATTPAPTTKVTTPVPTANATTPATTANATTPAPTTKVTTPAPTTNATRPATTANATTPATTTKVTTPAPTANATRPATTANATTTKVTTPAPTANATTPATTANATTANVTTPATTANAITPTHTANATTLPPTTNGTAPATTPQPKTNGSTPSPTTHGTAPPPKTNSSTAETKGPHVSASKGAHMSAGAIAGIVLGVLALLVAIVIGAICFRRHHRIKGQYRHSLMVDMDEL